MQYSANADVNGDEAINILDLVLVASVFEDNSIAAPSLQQKRWTSKLAHISTVKITTEVTGIVQGIKIATTTFTCSTYPKRQHFCQTTHISVQS